MTNDDQSNEPLSKEERDLRLIDLDIERHQLHIQLLQADRAIAQLDHSIKRLDEKDPSYLRESHLLKMDILKIGVEQLGVRRQINRITQEHTLLLMAKLQSELPLTEGELRRPD